MSLNFPLIIAYERHLLSKLNIDIDFSNSNENDIFLSLLNNIKSSNPITIYFLNKLLPSITNFNDICVKYFQILTDLFKSEMNKMQSNDNISLTISLNALTNFIKIFSQNQEKYNEKHKSILKQFPQFIQLLFKLFQQKYNNLSKKVIESFLLLFLSFIEFYPTLLRNYQNILEITIKNIFINYVVGNNNDINIIEIASVIYTNLYKLSPNMITRYNDYVEIIINNIKYYMDVFRPKSLNEQDENNKRMEIENKKKLFFVEKNNNAIIDDKNLIQANKVMNILFKLLENIFKYMINNTYFEINFDFIFSFFFEALNTYEIFINNKSISAIVINGLQKNNYELFLININENILDTLIFLISNYSRYIFCLNIFFSKYINKLLLNQNFFKNFLLHKKIIYFFSTIISYFYDILPDEIDVIIYKHLYNNLPSLYLNYLQVNDKTILEVNDIYFKAANVKNKIYDKNEENKILLIEYLKLLYNYCEVCNKIRKINNKGILGGIIDLMILPPFAKFIFNIDEEIKQIILDIFEVIIKKNLVYINKVKLFHFLNNFYFFDGTMKYKAECIINLLKIRDNELIKSNNGLYTNNNITEEIFDFNKKIKEYLTNAYKKIDNIIISDDKKEEIISENVIEKENKEMLNKKRKIKKEYQIDFDNNDIDERKGNKKKDNYINKGKKKELDLQKKIREEKEEKHDEKKENIEDMQIDGDIDIPDII